MFVWDKVLMKKKVFELIKNGQYSYKFQANLLRQY